MNTIIEKKEIPVGTHDEIITKIDTLYSVPVEDSLFSHSKPYFRWDDLPKIPGSDKEFSIFAGKKEIEKGIVVDLFEVVDTDPVDPKRTNGENPKGALKIGSRVEPKTSGNWK